jgi:hypothetical protein
MPFIQTEITPALISAAQREPASLFALALQAFTYGVLELL